MAERVVITRFTDFSYILMQEMPETTKEIILIIFFCDEIINMRAPVLTNINICTLHIYVHV